MTVNISLFAGAGAQFFSNDGVPLAGGLLYTYAAGTSTPVATYTTNSGLIANSNPIVLDSAGRTPQEIWLTSNTNVKFVLRQSDGTLIGTYDNIPGANDYSQLLADLANTSNPAKGDALIGFRQSNASGNLANAVGRTVHQKLQEYVSVKDFGALGNATTDPTSDDTAAFNNALATVGVTGGVVYVPPGQYRLTARITIPTSVKLMGLNWLPDIQNGLEDQNTSLFIDWGANQDEHAVEMSTSSGIEGFTFYYPGQVAKNVSPPIPFGYTISTPTTGSAHDNISIKNISLLNSYKGIRIREGGRFRIDQVQGEPIYIGFTCGANYDVCYMNGVHFWPFYTGYSPFSPSPDLLGIWKMENATAFEFFRVDQIYVTDCFAYGYNYGFHVRDSAWANFTNILTDTVNYPFRQVISSRVRLENFEFIGSGAVRPAVWWSDGGELVAVNGKIQDSSSVGFQIDGSTGTVLIDNVAFATRVTSVVVNNTGPTVKISNCKFTIPPFGIGNVSIDGIPLPDTSTAITLPAPTIAPTAITGGYEFDFTTGAVQILQYDFASIVQRNSLYVLSFDYELPVYNTLWYYNIQIQQDIGTIQQVNFGNLYPLMLNTTVAQPTRRVFIPFFANFGQTGQVLNIVITPTTASPGASLKLTNITLHEQANKITTDAQVAMMMKQGYNNDAQNMGQTLMAKGKNRIVLTQPEPGAARPTEVPTTGTWAVGDEVRVYNPVSGGFIGYVCITAGTPGTWVPFGFAINQVDTAANIVSITATINTTNKYEGKLIWDSTNNRMMRAAGSGANALWWVVDGSAFVTPV